MLHRAPVEFRWGLFEGEDMIYIDHRLRTPLYEQIYNQIKDQILSGERGVGTVLKPVRVLAEELGVSKNTIDLAYKQLVAEGYIASKRGSGYFVEEIGRYGTRPVKRLIYQEKPTTIQYQYDFSYDYVNNEEFDWKKWKKCIDEALYEEENAYEGYEDSKGDYNLRRCIRQYVSENRGVVCDEDQIVICSGTMYALDMSLQVLAIHKPNILRNATYFGSCEERISNLFSNKGYSVNAIEFSNTCDIISCSPAHQYIHGNDMGYEERLRCIQYAKRCDAYILENDSDSEFRYSQARIPCMQSMAEGKDNVIYIGTMSKVLSPTVRLAYLVLPKALIGIFEKLYGEYRTSVPVLHQRTLARYIEEGYMEKHIRRLVKSCDIKRTCLMKRLDQARDEGLIDILGNPTGGYVAICFKHEKEEMSLKDFARERKIRLHEVGGVYLIGFLSLCEEELKDAIDALYVVLYQYIHVFG